MTLFQQLSAKYPDASAASIAAMLEISRQAYSQAIQRGRLSDAAALRAAVLLDIDPGAALLANATSRPHLAAPEIHPTPPAPQQSEKCQTGALYYVKSCRDVQSGKRRQSAPMKNLHVITSQEQAFAVDVVKWCYAVAGIPADSPRFPYYVSRWDVPAKIAAAYADGRFATATAKCPPIDPAWLRFVPDALAEHRRYSDEIGRPRKTHASSHTPAAECKVLTEKAA